METEREAEGRCRALQMAERGSPRRAEAALGPFVSRHSGAHTRTEREEAALPAPTCCAWRAALGRAAAGRGARRPRGGEAGTAPPGRAEGSSPAEAPPGGDGAGERLAVP